MSDAPATPIADLSRLLREMAPVRNAGVYAWCELPPHADLAALRWLTLFREGEGTTVVLREEDAHAAGLGSRFRAAWITLTVPSDLEAVGLTAAFARALGDAGISCNVIAALHHDHLFVPVERADDALAALRALQASAPSSDPAALSSGQARVIASRYALASGAIFLLLVVAHAARIALEGWQVLTQPDFALATLFALVLSVWAWRVHRAQRRR
jgi:uncharacterized protein